MINWASEEKIPNIQQTQWAAQFKALIPYFDENEIMAGQQVGHIHIELPFELQKQQYFISLFNQTSQLVKQLTKTSGNFAKK